MWLLIAIFLNAICMAPTSAFCGASAAHGQTGLSAGAAPGALNSKLIAYAARGGNGDAPRDPSLEASRASRLSANIRAVAYANIFALLTAFATAENADGVCPALALAFEAAGTSALIAPETAAQGACTAAERYAGYFVLNMVQTKNNDAKVEATGMLKADAAAVLTRKEEQTLAADNKAEKDLESHAVTIKVFKEESKKNDKRYEKLDEKINMMFVTTPLTTFGVTQVTAELKSRDDSRKATEKRKDDAARQDIEERKQRQRWPWW
jgi:hypothetical protein